MSTDGIKWWPKVEVVKYNPETMKALARDLGHEPTPDELRALEALGKIEPDEVVGAEGNSLVTNGVTRIAQLITGTGTAFTATTGWCGVGDGTTSPTTAGMAALQGTNKFYKQIKAAPTLSAGTISATADYVAGEAEFAWQEWCWGISTAGFSSSTTTIPGSGAIMLNRAVQSLGTKAPGATWTLNASITIS